ncbi:hypothetical protein T459_00515 [Capsicum annuum]|uniref:Ubiquitin-like protease family profile domain-containing protein n=1 Tax=Capsicum annuum TaxID=4072 RepID=A0A2G3AEL4_CAPAN|nr:hypothetical protein T459_00515 [Capsicum annuum]
MKKLRQKHTKKENKKESGSKKRESNNPASKAPAKRRRIVEAIYRDELPKLISCSDLLMDCGVFVVVYVEYLSKELDSLSPDIDAQYHHLRYASFLCKYESEKAENDYFSENDDPPRTSSKFAPKQTDRVLYIQ